MTGQGLDVLSVVPPLLAIGAALVFRRVVPSLLVGVVLGSMIVHGAVSGLVRVADTYVLGSFLDSGHMWILALAIALGGMIRVIAQSGLSSGMARGFTRFATDRRRGQLTAWLLGICFFFDDYVNTLFVGSSMGAVSDRLRISREKLAFVVDATAAPVASLAPFSSWIAVEVGYIADQCQSLDLDADAFVLFLQSIPHRFYPVLMLVFGLLVALNDRDFGPMLSAEQRIQRTEDSSARHGHATTLDAQPALPPAHHGTLLSWAPIAVVFFVVLAGIVVTGRAGALAEELPVTPSTVMANAQASKAMVLAAVAGALTAVGLASAEPGRDLGGTLRMLGRGALSMAPVIAILLLAWSLGAVCKDLGTAHYLVRLLGPGFEPGLLPAAVFLISALTSFATGTSWGTMGIVFPLAVPLADAMAPGDTAVLLGTISSILAGSVFGDHCSPISDTTIMSAMATGCDQLAHVRTQLPYAAVVGLASVLLGSVPVGLGWYSPWVGLALGTVALIVTLRALAPAATGSRSQE